MNETNPNSNLGPAGRLMRLGEKLLSIMIEAGRTRAELVAVEFAIERARLVRLLILGLVFGATGLLGLAFASFWIIVFFWDSYRLTAIGCIAVLYGAIASIMLLLIYRMLNAGTLAFANTLDTLQQDYAAIQARLRRTRSNDVSDIVESISPRDRS